MYAAKDITRFLALIDQAIEEFRDLLACAVEDIDNEHADLTPHSKNMQRLPEGLRGRLLQTTVCQSAQSFRSWRARVGCGT